MNSKQMFVTSVIAFSIAAAFVSAAKADESLQSPTRAEVKALVLQARAHGQLLPAGEGTQPMNHMSTASTRTRAELRTEVLQARVHGELIASGEAAVPYEARSSVYSTLARATVREEVLMARLHGELTPSGEGFGPTDRDGHTFSGATTLAAVRR